MAFKRQISKSGNRARVRLRKTARYRAKLRVKDRKRKLRAKRAI